MDLLPADRVGNYDSHSDRRPQGGQDAIVSPDSVGNTEGRLGTQGELLGAVCRGNLVDLGCRVIRGASAARM